jgi:hypothetical protein
MRRVAGVVGAVVIAWLLLPSTGAAAQRVEPVVRVSATSEMAVHDQCFTEPTTEPGSFTLERTIVDGVLTVTYHISGGPTDLNSDAAAGEDHTVEFATGEATVTVPVHPAISAKESATVTIVDTDDYAVGDPDSGVVQIAHSTPQCVQPTQDTLARTGVKPTTAPLTLTGIVMLALGAALVAGAARRRTAG